MDEKTREAYQDWLTKWPFQWFLTIRLPSPDYSSYLNTIRNTLLRAEGGQIGYMGIFVNDSTGPHVHLVMIGRFRGRSLKDLDFNEWEMKINEIVRDKKGCKISEIFDLSGVARYIFSNKNKTGGEFELIPPWGRIVQGRRR
ncbi:MAG: hypothetical protein CVU52_01430 [Deltaproteobacteria bacterium HGW-Deltaproteobacteria-10]|nr:MAG: hypothetical protein CVU52_01430 [Deltaproteobacteria bacterium HGW-Deltaproteobacteria-10]